MKQGKGTALITGASAGIGAALAREFAHKGHDLILVARSADKLTALAGEIAKDHGVRVIVIAKDLGVAGAASALYLEVMKQHLNVDILVNNAGLLFKGPFADIAHADHQQLLQLNMAVLTELMHLFIPGMVARGHGRILNLASTSAFQPLPYLATYAATKAYVLSLSEAVGIELKDKGVTVTALCPGFTETDMIAKEGGKSMNVPFVKNMTPQAVAKQGYAACMSGKPLYINGMTNRALVEFGRYQPRWIRRAVSVMIAKTGY
jgi:short-subunit dehydrogenase